MSTANEVEDQIVASIRRIIRAIDLQSRRLQDRHKLTGPQLATLREAPKVGQPSISAVARERSEGDRRSVVIQVTDEGLEVLDEAPSLLQERFRAELARLEDWERHWMLSALERIASMMDAEHLDAAPILETGPVSQPAEEQPVPGGLEPQGD